MSARIPFGLLIGVAASLWFAVLTDVPMLALILVSGTFGAIGGHYDAYQDRRDRAR